MTSLSDLRPGDIGFGPISGVAGVTVRAGELLVAPFDHWRTWRQWRKVAHCGTVTQAASLGFAWGYNGAGGTFTRGVGPMFGQAMPPGYEETGLGGERWTADWIYIRPNYRDGQADLVAHAARRMAAKKIPYGFEDYAAIAGHRAGIHSKGLDDFIARADRDGYPYRAICSQAVDVQLTLSGGLDGHGHVFDDDRLPQDVTPSELYLRLLDLMPAAVFRPGVS